ncbi:MAG TPA: GNAT family N-acetyltransferase [Acidisarcina sp.]|nr:GNAT family N-acetyltransferase [Acidisarcina sp.]
MAISVRRFVSGDEEAFRRLNEAWIERYFGMEDADRRILGDPQSQILASGGQIYLALDGTERVGACALVKIGDGEFEVAKMAVAEERRGQGIGRQLLSFVIADARQMGARRLYIESNSRLSSALHLYESLGFRHLPPETMQGHFARCDVFMELLLPA